MRTLFKNFILLAALSFATTATAYDFMVDSLAYNINSDSTTVTVTYISIKQYENYPGLTSVDIPEEVIFNGKTYSVTAIGQTAFWDTSIESVEIPNTVKEIGVAAFNRCSYLASIIIPNSVISIGESAFANCWSLVNIVLPSSISTISSSTFHSCVSLNSFSIPNSVTSIGSFAFSKCSGLKSIHIPSSVVSIGNTAFSNCSSLTSITIPKSVRIIGGHAFRDCNSLSSIYNYINHPSDLTLEGEAFWGVDKTSCVLHVVKGRLDEYANADQWKDFINIVGDLDVPVNQGDVNGDGKVNVSDVTALINIILGIQ